MPLLEVKDLSVHFPGAPPVLDRISFNIEAGRSLCLVGESGSGKSMTALALMGILPNGARAEGRVRFKGEDLWNNRTLHHGHPRSGREMTMVFQEPMASLNPSMRIGASIGEALSLPGEQRRSRVLEALNTAGIRDAVPVAESYPWELSGGLAQRAVIAGALISNPLLLIADEPTTALDVTTQARILQVLLKQRDLRGLSLLFITHDLTLAQLVGGDSLVLMNGSQLESGPTNELLTAPRHPFTQLLVQSTPAYALNQGRARLSPSGPKTQAEFPSTGCPFAARCPSRIPACREMPAWSSSGGRGVACHAPLGFAETVHA